MLELYENLATRLQRFEPYLAAAAVALFLAVVIASAQGPGSDLAFRLLQLLMLWVCGLAVVSRLFYPDIEAGKTGARLSKVRTWRPFLRDISPHLMTSWFLLLLVATLSALSG